MCNGLLPVSSITQFLFPGLAPGQGGAAEATGVSGKVVPNAYVAALAIGCEFVSTDQDFHRFPGLRWRHPLDRPR